MSNKKTVSQEKVEVEKPGSDTNPGSPGSETSQRSKIIDITDIVIDPSVNVRHDCLSLDVVDAYSENPNLPPPEVMLIDGKTYLADGEHRLHAAIKRGDKTIKVVLVCGSTLDELRDHADLANLKHGLQLDRNQKREVAKRLHARHPKWSNRSLGERMGVTHPTIAAWLSEKPAQTGKDLPGTNHETVAGERNEPADTGVTTEPSANTPTTGAETPATTTVTCPKCGYGISIQ
jgi:hypothetical protein